MPLLSGEKSISLKSVFSTTLSKTNNVLEDWFERYVHVGQVNSKTLDSLKPVKCTSNCFITSKNSSFETGSQVISWHFLLLYKILQNNFHFSDKQSQAQMDLYPVPFSSQLHHFIDQCLTWHQEISEPNCKFKVHVGISHDEKSLSKQVAPMGVVPCGCIICMRKLAGFSFKT